MATVFLGALQGELGFRQLVAIKRPHPHLLDERGFRESWMREARLAAGIHHANVVDVRDVETVGDAVQLVMDYIEGASLGELVSARAHEGHRLPPGVAVRILLDACAGLHAAHEVRDEAGRPLGLVHRDVSPQNILVGLDGVARVTDFGIAKCAEGSEPATSQGSLKGKAGYMAPEYVRGEAIDRRADVFALGAVLWEAACGKRLFRGKSDAETLARILDPTPAPPVSSVVPDLAPLDAIVSRALDRNRTARYPSAEALGQAIEDCAAPRAWIASHAAVGAFVRTVAGERLEERRRSLRNVERDAPVATAEPTTRELPRPKRSRTPLALGVGGVLVLLAASGLVVRANVRGAGPSLATTTTTSMAPPTATATDLAPAPASATSTPTVSATATPTSSSSPARHGPSRPRPTAPQPPPNPYPAVP